MNRIDQLNLKKKAAMISMAFVIGKFIFWVNNDSKHSADDTNKSDSQSQI